MQEKKLKEYIEKIKTGNKDDIKNANKNIEQLWRSLERGSNERKRFVDLFISEFGNFDAIEDKSNRIAFVSSLKYFFMEAEEYDECFEACKRFVLYCMQNSSGHIRQAMIHASVYLIMFLRVFPDEFSKSSEGLLLKNRERFGKFIWDLDLMLDHYNKKEYKKYKYIGSLPPGIYKSLEMLRCDTIRGERFEKIYNEYRDKKLSTILPQINFKYTKLGADTISNGFECFICKKMKKRLGSSNPLSKKLVMICEDCAIDEYQSVYGYKTREAATARRRRLFDIGYLFQDMVTDRYLTENDVASIGMLEMEEMQNVFMLGKDLYDMLFDRGDKVELEEI